MEEQEAARTLFPPWRQKWTKLPFSVLQKPVRSQQRRQAQCKGESHWRDKEFVPLAYTSCSRGLAFHNEIVRKPSPLLGGERQKWPLCLMIWLWQLPDRPLPLVQDTEGARGDGTEAASGCPVVAARRKPECLLKQQRNCRAEANSRERKASRAPKKKKNTLLTGKLQKTQTLHMPRTCLTSPRISSTADCY